MSMTKEEKRKQLIDLIVEAKKLDPETGSFAEWLADFLVGYGGSFSPVSREQVEKAWRGCDICRGDKKIKSDNFCGAATMRVIGDSIDLRGDKKKIKFFGQIYAPSFSVKFCPFCGKPLTDEAVEMVMERWEAMKDG